MHKSIGQLDTAPKYAVINFCSAVELFLKARLLAEHWSLIITDIDKTPFIEAMVPVYERFVDTDRLRDLVSRIQATE